MAAFDPDAYLAKTDPAPQKTGGFDPDAYLAKTDPQKPPSEEQILRFNQGLVNYVKPLQVAAHQYDKYVAAPTRAFVSGVGEGKGIIDSAAQAAHEFGEEPNPYHSGKNQELRAQAERGEKDTSLSQVVPSLYNENPESVRRKGGPLDITKSGAWGAARDVVEDPLSLFGAASNAAKTLKATADGAGASEAIARAADKAKSVFVKGASKGGEALTGVPKGSIEHYVNNYDDVEKLIKESGGSQSEAADLVREGYQKSIQKTRQAMNDQISSSLEKSSNKFNKQDIFDKLDEAKSKLSPMQSDQAASFDAFKNKVNKAYEGDSVSSKAYMDILQDLRENTTYGKDGAFFPSGTRSEKLVKGIAADMRKTLNSAEPQIASANNNLAGLHDLESKINKNLIKTDKSHAALGAAGSGANDVNASHLDRLGKLTGTDATKQAKDFAASGYFGDAKLLPVDSTGKSVARVGLGRAVGAGVGGAIGAGIGGLHGAGYGAASGAYVGGLLTSPAALKAAIKTGRISAEAIGKAAGLIGGIKTDGDIAKAFGLLKAAEATHGK